MCTFILNDPVSGKAGPNLCPHHDWEFRYCGLDSRIPLAVFTVFVLSPGCVVFQQSPVPPLTLVTALFQVRAPVPAPPSRAASLPLLRRRLQRLYRPPRTPAVLRPHLQAALATAGGRYSTLSLRLIRAACAAPPPPPPPPPPPRVRRGNDGM